MEATGISRQRVFLLITMDILFLAGHRAYERIRSGGLCADDVKIIVGASGAAKWLVLHGLEFVLFGQWFAGRKKPLHLYGTSIGSWYLLTLASILSSVLADTTAESSLQKNVPQSEMKSRIESGSYNQADPISISTV